MRRPRHRLQVQTFPFLAVLLCTMGSLILLLLIIDRRAKAVARAKAEAAARQAAEAQAQAQAAQQAEWEAQRRRLHALLLAQDHELAQQLQGLRSRLAAVATQRQQQQMQQAALAREVDRETDRWRQEQIAQARRAAQAQAAARQQEERRQLVTQLAQQVHDLEQTLADLQALRRQQQRTWSVIPFTGPHGEWRQPLYVECAAQKVIFHPEKRVLQGQELTPLAVRRELEHRLPLAAPKDKPYLLLLVRPQGIPTYYLVLAALAGLNLDFGYELLDEDWVLDFSHANPPRGERGSPTASLPRTRAPAQGSSGPLSGTAEGGLVGPGARAAGEKKVPMAGGAAGMSAAPDRGSIAGPAPAAPAGATGGTVAAGPRKEGSTQFPSGSGTATEQPFPTAGVGEGAPPPGNRGGTSALPFPGSAPPLASPAGPLVPVPATGGFSGSPSSPVFPPALPRGIGPAAEPPAAGSSPSRAPLPGGEKEPSSAPAVKSAAPAGEAFSLPGPWRRRPPTPLGLLLGNRDWFITLDCRAEEVIVLSTGRRFSLATLQATVAGEHPLVQEIRQLIARRQAAVPAGEPPWRPVLRYRVDADGLRSYYLANALLSVLHLPAQRENLERPLIPDPFNP
jgi:hypothetical protein